jgi:hypothetical protein
MRKLILLLFIPLVFFRQIKDFNSEDDLLVYEDAQTIFYSLIAEYEKMLNPFFKYLIKTKF